MVLMILLLTGFGLLTSQESRYAAVSRTAEVTQAKALALAGLEDCRLKLQNDVRFPPNLGPKQVYFAYAETLDIPGPPVIRGNYQIIMDMTHYTQQDPANPTIVNPYQVIQITAIGTIGDPLRPTAQYRIKAEVDMSEVVRGTNNPNPEFCKFTHIEDESSI